MKVISQKIIYPFPKVKNIFYFISQASEFDVTYFRRNHGYTIMPLIYLSDCHYITDEWTIKLFTTVIKCEKIVGPIRSSSREGSRPTNKNFRLALKCLTITNALAYYNNIHKTF